MKAVIIFLLLSGVVLGQKIISQNGKDTIQVGKLTFGNNSNFVVTGQIQYYSNALNIFGTSLFIKDGRLEILYDKDIKPSESVKQFFEWVKMYVAQEYYLIKRKDLDKLLNK